MQIMENFRVASRYTPDTLPEVHSSICKAGVVSNFGVLAAFRDNSIPRGYVYLLEATMMVIFRSLCNGTFRKYNNPQTRGFYPRCPDQGGHSQGQMGRQVEHDVAGSDGISHGSNPM
jgi:hypothetical protein